MTDGDRNPPFNMAVATLMRLDGILKQIKFLHFQYPNYSTQKQNAHISLVKEFFINATPLLGDDAGTYKEEVLNLSMNKKLMVKSGTQMYVEVFDDKIEKRLNELLVDMQIKLKKFFMPSADDDDDDY